MFYFLVFIAAVTSSISLFEAIVTWRIDANREKGKTSNRTKIMCVSAVLSLIVGLPVALDAIGGGVTRCSRCGSRSVYLLRHDHRPADGGRDPDVHRQLA